MDILAWERYPWKLPRSLTCLTYLSIAMVKKMNRQINCRMASHQRMKMPPSSRYMAKQLI